MLTFLAVLFIGAIILVTFGPSMISGWHGSSPNIMADQSPSNASPKAALEKLFRDERFNPTPGDINLVRVMMSRAKQLPPDVVDMIFDHAEYWAHSSNYIDFKDEHRQPLRVVGRSRMEDKFLLRSFPVGLTTLDGRVSLAETVAYDTNEAKPLPLSREHDPRFFANLVDYPTPPLARPVRKVVFSIKSRDQGRGGIRRLAGTYQSTWTWFEAGLERFDADQECEPHCVGDLRYDSFNSNGPSLPMCALRSIQPSFSTDPEDQTKHNYEHPLHPDERYIIQRNKMATPIWHNNVVTWSWLDKQTSEAAAEELADIGRGRETGDGSFVRSLKMGDVITVWAKARFPAWVNMVERVKIDVYWAV